MHTGKHADFVHHVTNLNSQEVTLRTCQDKFFLIDSLIALVYLALPPHQGPSQRTPVVECVRSRSCPHLSTAGTLRIRSFMRPPVLLSMLHQLPSASLRTIVPGHLRQCSSIIIDIAVPLPEISVRGRISHL